jgi:hypothetical protein
MSLEEAGLIGRGHEREPLGGYAAIVGTFLGVGAGTGVLLARKGALPRSMAPMDLALLALSTNRLARLVAKEKSSRVLRAPFTDVAPDAKPSEVKEIPRGRGMLRAAGELVTCPFCVGVWAAAGLTVAHVLAPRATRFASAVLSVAELSDLLCLAFARK